MTSSVEDMYLCSIMHTLLVDPVIGTDGRTYERKNIERYLQDHPISPFTRLPMTIDDLVPNLAIRDVIESLETTSATTSATSATTAATTAATTTATTATPATSNNSNNSNSSNSSNNNTSYHGGRTNPTTTEPTFHPTPCHQCSAYP